MSLSPHVEREILSALIDGELSPDERRWVHEHLQGCDDCRDALEEFGHIHGLVGELPRLVAPLAFVSGALEKPRPDPRSVAQRFFSGRRRAAIIAIAAVSAAISLAGLVTPPESSEPPVGALIEEHIGVHGDQGPGADVLTAVGNR